MDIRNIPTYVINLDQNPDRLKYVQNNFKKIKIDVQRFPGIYAKGLDKSYLKTAVHPYVWYTIQTGARVDPEIETLGAVGCALSHIKLWKQLLESSDEVYHILEDDATPKSSVDEMNKFVNDVVKLDADWDVIYLGFNPDYIFYDLDHTSLTKSIKKINAISFGTQSYLVNRKGAEKLLKSAFPIVHHVDSYMSYMATSNGLHSYRSKTPLIIQPIPLLGSFASQVAPTIGNIRVIINRFSTSFLTLCILIAIFFFISIVIKAVARLR